MAIQPVQYYQTDPRWANISYSVKGESTTIGRSGCGPSSAAMVLATWADKNVTPKTECAWALKNGYKALKSGTYYSYFVPAFRRYGLTCKQLNGASIYGNSKSTYHATAKAAVDSGDLVIACMGKGTWTSSGHYVVVWKIAGDTIYINDPASSKLIRTQGNYTTFKSQVKYYWVIKNPGKTTGAEPKPATTETITVKNVDYSVKVTDTTGLNCRKGYSTSFATVKMYPYGAVVHISQVSSNNGGKTADVWINLTYTTKEDELDMTIAQMIEKMTNKEAYELLMKAFTYMSGLDEPTWSKAEGAFKKLADAGILNGGAPERPLRRDEFAAIIVRMGLDEK
jgi:hypothetical protein